MPLYQYIALRENVGRQYGTIDAPNKEVAEESLRERGYIPLDIAPVRQATNLEDIVARFRPIKKDLLVIFSRQLATMINADMSGLQAIAVLEEQQENPKFKDVLRDVIADLEAGRQLAEALAKHPEVFDRLYVAMVHSGEESGQLGSALQELALQLEKELAIRRAVKSATIYPKVVLGIAFLIVSGLLLTIVPTFAELFIKTVKESPVQPGKPKPSSALPVPTQIVVDLSHILYPTGKKDIGWVFFKISGEPPFIHPGVLCRFIGAFVFIYLIRRLIKRILREPGPRAAWDRYKLKAPMKIGGLIQKIAVARFSRTFASLLAAGVPAAQAMEIVADTSGNYVIAQAILEARDRLLAGATIHGPLQRAGVFPGMVTRMIQVGEESGSLEVMLIKVAEFYENEVDQAIKGFSSLIEPLMIFVVGAAIGCIVIAVYLPIFKIYDLIGTG
jgi:type IV pilus assembly protein PilC